MTEGAVFLSHSSKDATEVERLRAALESRGIACFLDALELRAGDELAIELKREFGHAAEPWRTWSTLSGVERDLGNTEAAVIARQRAIDTYVAYRRDGGYPQQATRQLVTQLTAALAGGTSPQQIVSQLTTPPGAASNVAAFFTCLRAILSGGRDPALLADPALHYSDVVELTLLLETLSSPSRPGQT